MSETNKSIVEEALLSMKNLEEIISENAKGILASTMKQEIGELVKESLSGSKKRSLREEEEAPEEGDELPLEDEELEPADDEDDEMDAEMDAEMDFQEPIADKQELPALDMTQSPMSDVLKVFKLMGDDDGIIVQKDEKGDVHIKDQENEYIIVMDDINTTQTMNESYEDEENYGDEMDDVGPFNFNSLGSMGEFGEEETFEMYEQDEDEMYEEDLMMGNFGEQDEMYEQDEDEMYEQDEDEMGESVFEIDQEALESVIESFKYSKNPNMDKVSYKKKEGPKRYGKGGSAKKDIYPSKLKHGVSEMGDKEEEFEGWEQTEDSDLIFTDEDYGFETPEKSEASRTYGNGSKKGRGLRKGITPNRNMTYESVAREMDLLREKNEEYKKALGFFKNKINEVAVFNSNLAYSTRLFTEHSTTKQEKINILRRFDNVETIKESKNLYQSIKKELDGKGSENVVKESITERVIKTPQNGSATNLIETKTYENPQFMRMRDLMTKIK
jgi:hypothetical protein